MLFIFRFFPLTPNPLLPASGTTHTKKYCLQMWHRGDTKLPKKTIFGSTIIDYDLEGRCFMTDSILRELSFKSQILHRGIMAANGRNKETHKATQGTQCSSFSKNRILRLQSRVIFFFI